MRRLPELNAGLQGLGYVVLQRSTAIPGSERRGDRALVASLLSDQVVTSADSKKHIQINEYNIIVWVVIPLCIL